MSGEQDFHAAPTYFRRPLMATLDTTITDLTRPSATAWSGLRLSVRARLAAAVEHLARNGTLNRSDVERVGEVSMPQASTDIAQIMQRAPGLMLYDKSEKTYRLHPAYKAPWLDALSSIPEQGVEVKALEWHQGHRTTLSRAESVVGLYRTWTHFDAGGKWYWSLDWVEPNNVVATEAEAKSAAQADYEARIRSALAPSKPAAVALPDAPVMAAFMEGFGCACEVEGNLYPELWGDYWPESQTHAEWYAAAANAAPAAAAVTDEMVTDASRALGNVLMLVSEDRAKEAHLWMEDAINVLHRLQALVDRDRVKL